MNREILFRAKRIDNGEWVQGDLVHEPYGTVVQYYDDEIEDEGNCAKRGSKKRIKATVDLATICQYTGLTDETEKKIYEGDIVVYIDTYSTESGYAESDCVGEVVWDEDECCFHVTGRLSAESYEVLGDCCVVGNIFDNPELMD